MPDLSIASPTKMNAIETRFYPGRELFQHPQQKLQTGRHRGRFIRSPKTFIFVPRTERLAPEGTSASTLLTFVYKEEEDSLTTSCVITSLPSSLLANVDIPSGGKVTKLTCQHVILFFLRARLRTPPSASEKTRRNPRFLARAEE